jgi:uncharacterized protein (DUF1810 family)
MSLIAQVLAGSLESEKEKAYALRFEELSQWKTAEVLHRELRELIKNTNQTYFRKLQKLYAKDITKLKSLLTLAREHHLI